jgi:hypothetical protein
VPPQRIITGTTGITIIVTARLKASC